MKKLVINGKNISERTVKRRLVENGFKYRSTMVKPLISEKHAKHRLKFAKKNMHRDWSNVIFSDEATFSTYAYQNKAW